MSITFTSWWKFTKKGWGLVACDRYIDGLFFKYVEEDPEWTKPATKGGDV